MSDGTPKNGDLIPYNPKADIKAGGSVVAFIPQTLDEAWRLSQAVARGGFAPPALNSADKIMVAVMHGAEVGMTPFQSIKSIAVINNRPTIWGDATVALVLSSGKAEYIAVDVEGEGDAMVATARTKRKGWPDESVATFSAADAKRAGVWGKGGPWTQYPKRMLGVRARSFLLRDIYPDVLGGLYIREEVEDEDVSAISPPRAIDLPPKIEGVAIEVAPPAAEPAAPARRARKSKDAAPVSEAAPPSDSGQSVEAVAAVAEDAAAEAPAEGEIVEGAALRSKEEILEEMNARMAAATDTDALSDIWEELKDEAEQHGRSFVTVQCEDVFSRHEARIQTALVAAQGKAREAEQDAPAAAPPAAEPPAAGPPPAAPPAATVPPAAMADRPEEEPAARGRERIAFENGVVAGKKGDEKKVPAEYARYTSLAAQWTKGYEQAAAAAAADRVAQQVTPARGEPTEADLDQAYNLGRDMQKKGATRRAVPPEYRGGDAWGQAMAAEWQAGWDFAAKN